MTSTADDISAEIPSTGLATAEARSVLGRLIVGRSSELARLVLKVAMGIIVVAVWLPSMMWGFITDEHITAWVTQDGFTDTISRAQEHQGNSPTYFVLVWVVRQVLGASSFALRLPSVVALLAGAFHLTRLGEELDKRDVGLVASFVVLVNGHVLIRGVTARPYGILLLLLVVSMRYVHKYLQSHRPVHGLVWVASAALSLHMTPFAAAMLLPHLMMLWNAHRQGTLPRTHWARLGALGALLVVPLTPQILDLAARSDSLVISLQPSLQQLAEFIVPSIAVLSLLAGFMLGGVAGADRWRPDSWRVVVVWAVAPTILLFLVGVTGTPIVGVSRYRLGALPGTGLVVGMLIVRLRRPLGYLVAVLSLVVLSMIQLSSHTAEREGWKEATEWAMTEIEGSDAIMAYGFGLVEQHNVAQVADPHFADYFTAPALAYGVEHPVRPLPIGEGPEVAAYLDTLFVELSKHDTVALVTTMRGSQSEYPEIFTDRLEGEGYRALDARQSGFVAAMVFVRD